jgi:Carboxypeptidase regulatory-like domain
MTPERAARNALHRACADPSRRAAWHRTGRAWEIRRRARQPSGSRRSSEPLGALLRIPYGARVVVTRFRGNIRPMRRYVPFLLFAAFAISAVAPSLSTASVVRSGLRGLVLRGPTSPMCQPGTPCTAPAADVGISFVRDSVVRHVRTNAAGRYSIRLAPGKYAVRISVARAGFSPRTATVSRRQTSVLNIRIDTGIR